MSEAKRRGARGERTRAVHGADPGHRAAMSAPIERSVAFAFPDLEAMRVARDQGAAGAFYQRIGHPTVHACERRLAALEGAEDAVLFASGTAALSALLLASLKPGEHVVSLAQGYGGTIYTLRWGAEHLGWTFDLVDARDPDSWAAAFRPETRLLHLETPTNPTLDVVDLEAAAALAHDRGALLSVDNTVASPVGQHPLERGADVVIYSATKSIGGHTDLLAGAALGSRTMIERLWRTRVVIGGATDPEVAWLVERSVKTLPLRVERANANALALAQRLAATPGVTHVRYPGLDEHPGRAIAERQMHHGFGPLLAFEVAGGDVAAERVVNALRLIRHAASLGSVESLACLPSETSHRFMTTDEIRSSGIPAGLVRLSAGIEDVEDLWEDLSQALATAHSGRSERKPEPAAPGS